MLLHVIARGKIARSPEAELVERYAKRIAWPLKLTELPESGGRIPEPQTPLRTVLLDERGEQLPSGQFAEMLRGVICLREGQWPPRLHDVEELEQQLMKDKRIQKAIAEGRALP